VAVWRSRFDLIGLTEKEVGLLYTAFEDVASLSSAGCVNTKQLMAYCKIDKHVVAAKMLASFKKGQTFAGFVFELWDVCTTDQDELADFVFALYDVHGDGINAQDAMTLLTDLFGETAFKARRTEILTQLFDNEYEPKPITRAQFKSFTRKQATTLFLVFNVQRKICESVVGRPFWEGQAKNRARMSPEDLKTISQVRQDVLTGRLQYDTDGLETGTKGAGKKTASAAAAGGGRAGNGNAGGKAPPRGQSQRGLEPSPFLLADSRGKSLTNGALRGPSYRGTAPPHATVPGSPNRLPAVATSPSSGSVTPPEPADAPDAHGPVGFHLFRGQSEKPDRPTALKDLKDAHRMSQSAKAPSGGGGVDADPKKKKKKLVESNKLDRQSLKAVLKAASSQLDEEDDDAVAAGAAAISLPLSSPGQGGSATSTVSSGGAGKGKVKDADKGGGGFGSLFGGGKKKAAAAAAAAAAEKQKRSDEPPPPLPGILRSERAKKRPPSDKKVLFDVPEGPDEVDYDL